VQKIVAALLSTVCLAAAAPPKETVTPAFRQGIPNIPGKVLLAAVVDYPPGGASPAHRHAPSAFIFAYVLQGSVRSSVNGSPVKIYGPGESWSEPPGAHHSVSENASATKHARLLAVFVLDATAGDLVIPDDPHRQH
jgi:quercetin dioxygenase-like cupin family protein